MTILVPKYNHCAHNLLTSQSRCGLCITWRGKSVNSLRHLYSVVGDTALYADLGILISCWMNKAQFNNPLSKLPSNSTFIVQN